MPPPLFKLQPPPFRIPFLDAAGEPVELWRRFFLSAADLLNSLLLVNALGTPHPGTIADDMDMGDGWVIPGPQGPPGLPNVSIPPVLAMDSDTMIGEELWPTVVGGLARSGLIGLVGPVLVATGRTVAATGAVASVVAYTVGASDSSFIVSMNLLITAFTIGSVSGVITYTDEGNTARSLTMNFSSITGVLATTAGAAGAFEGVPLHLRAKASTVITVTTTVSAFTGTYNVEGILQQVA